MASPRQAALQIIAAVGGMLVPALICVVASGGGVEVRGWAIPMATEIAFALGALSVVAPRVTLLNGPPVIRDASLIAQFGS